MLILVSYNIPYIGMHFASLQQGSGQSLTLDNLS